MILLNLKISFSIIFQGMKNQKNIMYMKNDQIKRCDRMYIHMRKNYIKKFILSIKNLHDLFNKYINKNTTCTCVKNVG